MAEVNVAEIIMQTLVSGLLWGFVFALIAVGLTIIFGVMDIVNFAHGDFLMMSMFGAYVFSVYAGLDPMLSLPLVVAFMFGFGVVVYQLIIKRVLNAPMLAQIFATFGLLVFLRGMATLIFRVDYRTVPDPWLQGTFSIGGIVLSIPQVVAAIGAMVITALVYWFIMKTETGWALQAVAEDKQAAFLMGINSDRMYALAWGLGSACVAVAGVLLSNFYYIFPEVGAVFGLIAFISVALGGFGSVTGALVAGVLIGVAEVLGGFLVGPAYKYALVFAIYLIVVVIRPKGLMGKV